MRAGWYERPGSAYEVITVGEMPTPEPGPGEVRVRVHASGISPSDYKRRASAKGGMEFPRIVPHSDGAGVVDAIGEGVVAVRPGDRVWVMDAQYKRPFGTAAEYVVLPQAKVAVLPDNVSFEAGACLGIPAITLDAGGTTDRKHALEEWIDLEKTSSLRGMQMMLATLLTLAGIQV